MSNEIYSEPEAIEKQYPGSLYKNIDETVCLIWHKKDEFSDKLYVAFRGAEIELENAITIINLTRDPVDYQDGEIHSGFKIANDLIWPWLSEQLQDINENTQIIFTGKYFFIYLK